MNRLVLALLAITSEVGAQPGVTPDTRDLDEPSPPPPALANAPLADHAFVGGGSVLGHDEFFNAAFAIEGGIKLGAAPLWVRGLFAAGSSFDFAGGGSLVRGMIGLELRHCRFAAFCGFVGVDAGYQQQTWSDGDEMTEHHDGLLVGPRVGIDGGGARVRFRLAAEVVRYDHHASTGSSGWESGGGVTMTVVYRL